eukprot:843051-Prymnesium_polylepis.2
MSLYETLGVTRDASAAEITRAYRKRAQPPVLALNHPGQKPGHADAESRFLRVTLAYDVLSNATKRARYDDCEGYDSHIFEALAWVCAAIVDVDERKSKRTPAFRNRGT